MGVWSPIMQPPPQTPHTHHWVDSSLGPIEQLDVDTKQGKDCERTQRTHSPWTISHRSTHTTHTLYPYTPHTQSLPKHLVVYTTHTGPPHHTHTTPTQHKHTAPTCHTHPALTPHTHPALTPHTHPAHGLLYYYHHHHQYLPRNIAPIIATRSV